MFLFIFNVNFISKDKATILVCTSAPVAYLAPVSLFLSDAFFRAGRVIGHALLFIRWNGVSLLKRYLVLHLGHFRGNLTDAIVMTGLISRDRLMLD